MKIGIEGFSFDSAHYTEGISDKCSNIHGHTFTVDVRIEEGEINKEDGMVLDFGILKNNVRKVLENWDHKLLVPQSEMSKIETKGEFNLEIKPMEENAATTENIAKEIAKEIYEKT
ncbi:hypothetical protein AKJ49_01235, partial [candidate division MSBL1 archaeon SCGC-AAA382A03]